MVNVNIILQGSGRVLLTIKVIFFCGGGCFLKNHCSPWSPACPQTRPLSHRCLQQKSHLLKFGEDTYLFSLCMRRFTHYRTSHISMERSFFHIFHNFYNIWTSLWLDEHIPQLQMKYIFKRFSHLSLVPQGRVRECLPPWEILWLLARLTSHLPVSTYC